MPTDINNENLFLNSLNSPNHMSMEIHVLAWEMQETSRAWSRLMGSKPFSRDNWII
jgi:hypothetical protein